MKKIIDFKEIDNFNEIDENLCNTLKKIKPVLEISEDKFKYIKNNISVLTKISEKKIKKEKTSNFQELLRIQNELMNNSIKLVGIDISRTIVEYKSNLKTQTRAANIIKKKYYKIFKNYTTENIVDLFLKGFDEYNKKRVKTNLELSETFVYKKYIFKNFNSDIYNLDVLKDIIKIWLENSVDLNLNATKIVEIIEELKKRNLIVVSISDMLGNMSKYALKYFGIYDLFDGHFCSNDFKYRKSHKKNSLYKHILKYYKLKPENCLMIGNDKIDDIKSSIENGWEAIYTSYGNTDIKNDKVIITVNKLDDLLSLLKENKIKELPLLEDDMKLFSDDALRNNDSNEYIKTAYYIRQKTKNIANRELREYIYKTYLISECGKKTRLGNNIEIRNPYKIIIGDNCQINDNFTALNENYILIGNNVMIANNVFISTYKHSWKRGMLQDNIDSWKKGDTKTGCVSIEDNCWIGPNCSFESNVYLGHHSVVSANTLVKTGVYPPYSLIVGNPARILKNIKKDLIIEGKIK